MAELLTVTRSQVDITAGRKTHPTAMNRDRVCVITAPATYAAPAAADTAGTGLNLVKGSRVLGGVLCSVVTGGGGTVSIGIRDAQTKAVIDATAVVNAFSLAAASTAFIFTGTKIINGQYYLMPQEVELYLTFAGTPVLNIAFRFEVHFVAP
jgi:hypothetical protein